MNTLLKVNTLCPNVLRPSILFTNSIRTNYTFNLNTKLVKYRRATRPKKTNDNSISLNYEQSQFAEKIGVTKSWNSWNTSNLLEGKRQAETSADDLLIRKFIYGTFHGMFASEILIKRKFNTINISFLAKLPNYSYIHKTYFLVGYAEELLSCLLKCVVKINVQTIYHKNDLVFRTW
ncbi:unnamed protein product [Brachionus calyciflorus]|uniref:28S ribosomal protein S24 n=1 Tax=Brachionus calyciflorus TaxID=104777 RepID=A0A814B9I9_9BILA|nr:unnamed protein product [Brachionus calyciflorus]